MTNTKLHKYTIFIVLSYIFFVLDLKSSPILLNEEKIILPKHYSFSNYSTLLSTTNNLYFSVLNERKNKWCICYFNGSALNFLNIPDSFIFDPRLGVNFTTSHNHVMIPVHSRKNSTQFLWLIWDENTSQLNKFSLPTEVSPKMCKFVNISTNLFCYISQINKMLSIEADTFNDISSNELKFVHGDYIESNNDIVYFVRNDNRSFLCFDGHHWIVDRNTSDSLIIINPVHSEDLKSIIYCSLKTDNQKYVIKIKEGSEIISELDFKLNIDSTTYSLVEIVKLGVLFYRIGENNLELFLESNNLKIGVNKQEIDSLNKLNVVSLVYFKDYFYLLKHEKNINIITFSKMRLKL